MGIEEYEDAVATAMWKRHGIRRLTAFAAVDTYNSLVVMAHSKGRDWASVAKALAEKVKS